MQFYRIYKMPTTTHYIDGDNYQLRQIIFANTPKAIEQCKSIARQFQGETELQTCKNIFDFLKTQIRYEADGSHQKVKLPSALMRERVGDCKSYSLFTGAILSNLGIGWKYVLVSYREDPTPTHIYVVTDSGIIIDAVWGIFNSEKVPTHKYYHKPIDMKISTISGIGGYQSNRNQKITPTQVQGISGAFDWYKANKGKEPSWGEQVDWGLRKVAMSLPRLFVLEIFKKNGGGISSMINNLVFKTSPTYYTIPRQAKIDLAKKVEAKRIQLGVPALTESQRNTIWYTPTIDASKGSTFTFDPSKLDTVVNVTDSLKKEADAIIKRYEAMFGKGSWTKYGQWMTFKRQEEDKLTNAYTVYPSEKAREKWKGFENDWFWKGGDPTDIVNAVKEGATKPPKGKDFNYVIRIGMERGLKAKDTGLVIRAITGVAFGSTFSLDSSDSFVMNKGKGIGAVDWVAIGTAIKGILELLGMLFALFKMFFPSDDSGSDGSGSDGSGNDGSGQTGPSELEKHLASGWMTKDDAIGLKAPYPYLEEKTVDGVVIVKVDPSWLAKLTGGSQLAGFGQIALPLLIGGAVIMALNTSKKITK